jgi:hypothetical protein
MMKLLKSKIAKWGYGLAVLALLVLPARFVLGDYTLPQPGTALTVFGFTCFSTKTCPATTLTDSAGVEKATAANPVVTSADPCASAAKTSVPFSSASGTFALVTGVSAKKIYVCSIILFAPTAVSVSLAEGSSSTCGTSAQAAVIGVATSGTASQGMALAANGAFAYGNSSGTVAQTATNANYLCVFQSGTAQLAGNLTYVQQ